ncbi:MAG: class I SAM-dependent methyltransferase [Candidatus Limnocylindrales bacterium]
MALARYYELDFSDGHPDVAMYRALAAGADGPILELACGTGRVAVPLAAAGHDVVGVDIDATALELANEAWAKQKRRAKARGGTLRLAEKDITMLALDERFDLVILALNTLLLMPGRDGQRRVLEVMVAHLARHGRAVLDVWLPTPDDLSLYDGRLILEWVKRDRATGETVSKATAATFEPAAETAQISTFYDAWHDAEPPTRIHRTDSVTFIGAKELLTMLETAGLEPEMVAGDYDMSDFKPESERVIVVCRANRVMASGPSGSGRKKRSN